MQNSGPNWSAAFCMPFHHCLVLEVSEAFLHHTRVYIQMRYVPEMLKWRSRGGFLPLRQERSNHLLSTYYMLGNVVDALHVLSHLNLKISHGARYYNTHFTDGGNWGSEMLMKHTTSHNLRMVGAEIKPWFFWHQVWNLPCYIIPSSNIKAPTCWMPTGCQALYMHYFI